MTAPDYRRYPVQPPKNPTPGLFRLDDQLRVRRAAWVDAEKQPTCWHGHALSDSGGSTLVCVHRPSPLRPACGSMVWVHRFERKGRLWLADVASDEARMFRELELTVDDILRYFGATL